MKYELKYLKDYGDKKGNIALIFLPGHLYSQYAVVRNIDLGRSDTNDDLWDWGNYFPNTISGLQSALDYYRCKTEENYITRARLTELATNFKDRIYDIDFSMDEDEITEELIETFDIADYEAEFFGMKESEE